MATYRLQSHQILEIVSQHTDYEVPRYPGYHCNIHTAKLLVTWDTVATHGYKATRYSVYHANIQTTKSLGTQDKPGCHGMSQRGRVMLGRPQQNHIVCQGGLAPWMVLLCSLICLRRTHHIKRGTDRYTCLHCYRGLNTYLWQNNWDSWQSKPQVQKQWLENNNICGQFFRSDKRMQITRQVTVQLSPYSQTICSIYAIRLLYSILGDQALMVISLFTNIHAVAFYLM